MKTFIRIFLVICAISGYSYAGKSIEGNIIRFDQFNDKEKILDEGFTCKFRINSTDKNNDNVDYVLDIYRPQTESLSRYFIEFIDKDGFIIHKSYLGKFVSNYSGITRGTFILPKYILQKTESLYLSFTVELP